MHLAVRAMCRMRAGAVLRERVGCALASPPGSRTPQQVDILVDYLSSAAPMLDALPMPALQDIARTALLLKLPAGTVALTQGKPVPGLCIVLRGGCCLPPGCTAATIPMHLGVGSVFGALPSHAAVMTTDSPEPPPCEHTLTATTETSLVVVSAAATDPQLGCTACMRACSHRYNMPCTITRCWHCPLGPWCTHFNKLIVLCPSQKHCFDVTWTGETPTQPLNYTQDALTAAPACCIMCVNYVSSRSWHGTTVRVSLRAACPPPWPPKWTSCSSSHCCVACRLSTSSSACTSSRSARCHPKRQVGQQTTVMSDA